MVGQYTWDIIHMGLMVSARDGIEFVDVVRRLQNVRVITVSELEPLIDY